MRDSFIFYRSFYEAIKDLPHKEFDQCVRAICEYGLNGQIVEVNGKMSKVAMTLILPQLEANYKRYANGSKGGRPKKTNGFENKKPNGYEKKKPNKNVNDNENVNVNDNVLKEKQKKEKSDDFCVCEKTIEYLNEKCGTKYDPENEELHKQIKDRIREGHTLEEFKSVIDKKSRDWINTSMERHLNPVTLFKTIKFDVYLGEPDKKASSVKAFPVTPPMMENGQMYDAMEELLIEN